MRKTTSDPVSVADRPASSSPEHPRSTLRFHPEAEQAFTACPSSAGITVTSSFGMYPARVVMWAEI